MGARGPKPTPSAVLQRRGTYRGDRAAGTEATPLGKPKCPSWVTDPEAKAEFRRIAKTLAAMGLVGASDSNALTRYAVTWIRWRRAAQALMEKPSAEVTLYRDETGKVKAAQVSALHSIARSLGEELSRLENVIGMNPSARSRIEVSMTPLPPPTQNAPDRNRFFDSLN